MTTFIHFVKQPINGIEKHWKGYCRNLLMNMVLGNGITTKMKTWFVCDTRLNLWHPG